MGNAPWKRVLVDPDDTDYLTQKLTYEAPSTGASCHERYGVRTRKYEEDGSTHAKTWGSGTRRPTCRAHLVNLFVNPANIICSWMSSTRGWRPLSTEHWTNQGYSPPPFVLAPQGHQLKQSSTSLEGPGDLGRTCWMFNQSLTGHRADFACVSLRLQGSSMAATTLWRETGTSCPVPNGLAVRKWEARERLFRRRKAPQPRAAIRQLNGWRSRWKKPV